MDLNAFAAEVGEVGPVTIEGAGSRGRAVESAKRVSAPSGIVRVEPDEMIVECGAGTSMAELEGALAEVGQMVAAPSGGTIGGALAVGRSGIRRLGDGPIRDVLLQAKYVDAGGQIVTAGGPTVKNVSGFDLCRLLVGSWGTLGFIGSVILRTRPIPRHRRWFQSATDDPAALFETIYRPTCVLWDGEMVWALLEGHETDVADSARAAGMVEAEPPALPDGGRWSMPPGQLGELIGSGTFVAELGVGIVHHELPAPVRIADPGVVELHARIKRGFDPDGRLNPGLDVLSPPSI